MKTKILYIHHDGLITGSALSLRNLLLSLDRNHFSPRVLLAQEGPARKLYEDLNIPVDVFTIRGFPTSPGYRWRNIEFWKSWLCLLPNLKLENYLRRIKPDIVHINDKMMITAGITANRLNYLVVWHIRSSYNVTNSWLAAYASKTIIKKKSDHIIAISEDEIDGFEGFRNLSIVYNSVDFDKVDQALKNKEKVNQEFNTQGKIVIGTVSTAINEIRGTYDFIEAVGLLKKLLPNTNLKFIIVSKIPQEVNAEGHNRNKPYLDYQKALRLVSELNIENETVFTGYREDALSIMAAMDIVVVCNRHGVLGRVPFEAMALGRPLVVTSGHSGNSRVVVNGKTGIIVPSRNPQSIASAIIKLVRDPEMCLHIGGLGIAYAHQNFDSKKNVKLVEEIYKSLLESKKANY